MDDFQIGFNTSNLVPESLLLLTIELSSVCINKK